MLTKKDLEDAKKLWEKVKTQGQIDVESAEMYLEIVNKKLEVFENEGNN